MEPILTKAEIADLLAAIRSGRVSVDQMDAVPGPSRRHVAAAPLDLCRVYERREAGGEMRIPNLDIVLDSFARKFATNLTNTMLRNFTVEREVMAATTFQQSLLDLGNQGAVGIYNMTPLKHGCIIHFDTLMAFTLLEIMLGSSQSSDSLALDRNLTTIEIAILRSIMVDLSNDLQNALLPVADLEVKLNKVENNFRLVNIVEPEVEVLVTRFHIRLAGELCGEMQAIIPYFTLEPLRDKFKGLVTIAQAATNSWAELIAWEAMHMENEVVACSGLVNMTIRQILGLKVGAIVDLNYNPEQPLTILVQGQPLFQAVAGERNGKKAFHVNGPYTHKTGGIHGHT